MFSVCSVGFRAILTLVAVEMIANLQASIYLNTVLNKKVVNTNENLDQNPYPLSTFLSFWRSYLFNNISELYAVWKYLSKS